MRKTRPTSYQLLIVLFPTGFRELARIGQTVPTKMCTMAGYQEIFAEFIQGAKPSEAQWYSIKPLHQGIPSLADLLEVSSENLQILLMKAGTGNLGKRDKLFSFQSSKFESFRSSFTIQDACETTQRKVKGMKTKQWFVRLGTQFIGDLSDPGTTGRAPRVKNIRAVRRDFQDVIAKTRQPTTYIPQWILKHRKSEQGMAAPPRVLNHHHSSILKEDLCHLFHQSQKTNSCVRRVVDSFQSVTGSN